MIPKEAGRSIKKRDVAMAVTIMTFFFGVLRYGERRLDQAEANAKDSAHVEIKAVEKSVNVERQERQENIRLINGKLDTIIQMLDR